MTNLPGTPLSRSAFLAVAGGLVVAACGGTGNSSSTRSPLTPTVAGGPTAGPAAPALDSAVPTQLVGATTIYGEPFDANTLAGRPTVAWFWAAWCVICRGEAPDVVEVAALYAGQVNFIGISGRGEASEARDFVAKTGTEGIVHLDDSSGNIWASYGIYGQPAYAFITADGRLDTYIGSLGRDGLVNVIDQLIVA
ncbi:MAG: TlpA family protein disulfide reductase [Actinobacteria bacterium]|nr:TlpA family protein disulfide reductase [Actinomycetota bacterium]